MDPRVALESEQGALMGDKSQLIAMSLAHRYRIEPVIAGVFLAFLVSSSSGCWPLPR